MAHLGGIVDPVGVAAGQGGAAQVKGRARSGDRIGTRGAGYPMVPDSAVACAFIAPFDTRA